MKVLDKTLFYHILSNQAHTMYLFQAYAFTYEASAIVTLI